MKRIISSILLVVLMLTCTIGALTSCDLFGGGGGGNSSDFVMPEGGFDTTTPVTIKFYHQMGKNLQDVLNIAIEDFRKIYPNITVEHASYGDYDGVRDQIKNDISVGDQPNIAYCYPDHVALYNVAGAVQTLDVFIDDPTYGFTAAQKADFIEGFYSEGMAFGDGKMYSLPVSKSTEVLFYNKTFFEENNLTVPTNWDEMEAVCRAIKAIDPTSIPLGYDSSANWFITMCEQSGSGYTSATGDNFLFDNATNKAFIKKFQTWYKDKLVTTEGLNGKYTSSLFTATTGTKSYMCIGSTGGTTYQTPGFNNGKYAFEVGIAAVPQVNASAPKVISQGPSICVFKDSNPQEVLASWLFVKFLTTDVTFQGAVSMTNGYTPVIKSVQNDPAYKAFLDAADENPTANLQAYSVKVSLAQASSYYSSPAFNGSSAARDQVGILLDHLISQDSLTDEYIDQKFKEAVDQCKFQAGQ